MVIAFQTFKLGFSPQEPPTGIRIGNVRWIHVVKDRTGCHCATLGKRSMQATGFQLRDRRWVLLSGSLGLRGV